MDDPLIGQIQIFGFQFAPRDWEFCDGSILGINQNASLYSLLGDRFGGDGRNTFGLPDLRGRVAIGMGQAPALSNYAWGQHGGMENFRIDPNQLPEHTHPATWKGTSDSSLVVTVVTTVETFLQASTLDGQDNNPAPGEYLASVKGGGAGGQSIYRNLNPSETGTLVDLGGVESTAQSVAKVTGDITGTVTVSNNATDNVPVDIRQPYLALNYCIALEGIYPSRN